MITNSKLLKIPLIHFFCLKCIIFSAIPSYGNELMDEYFALGKSRIYESIGICRDDTTYYKQTVVGDTIIGNEVYKIIDSEYIKNNENSWSFLGYEENGIIYVLSSESEDETHTPYLDFNLNEGDTAYYSSEKGIYENYGMYVGNVQYMNIKGFNRKVMTIERPKGYFIDFWIEGIGALYSHHICGQPQHKTVTLIGCYLGDQCIFDSNDILLLCGTEDIEATDQLKIFQDKISYNAMASETNLSLYSMDGTLYCRTSGVGLIEISTQYLNSGIYIVEICNDTHYNLRKKIHIKK